MANRFSAAAFTGVLLLAVSHVFAASAPISLKLTMDCASVKAGSEVKVTVTVTNESKQQITIASGTTSEIYKIEVRDIYGRLVPEKKRARIRSLTALTLDSRGSHEDEVALDCIYDLSHPGKYSVQFPRNSRYEPDAGTETVTSNLLVFNVTE